MGTYEKKDPRTYAKASKSSETKGKILDKMIDLRLPTFAYDKDQQSYVQHQAEVHPTEIEQLIEHPGTKHKREQNLDISRSEGNVSKKIKKSKFSSPQKTYDFIGLQNQGATCYMNSVLQILYFTNGLRKALHMMPTTSREPNYSVVLALQRIFSDLQYADQVVHTTLLTNALNWEGTQANRQHDVQEFLRTLLEILEKTMKGTIVEGIIPRLFKGEMRSFIKCKFVDYKSTRTETFYDIQLNIKGKKNLHEAFNHYLKTELLDGNNKYDAGIHGLQEAEKGVIFTQFPPVLHLHLLRFQYDPINNCSIKFNDRFEFTEKLDLREYLESGNETCCTYTLQAVLVHIGHDNAGHYVVYVDPEGNGQWYKFNDAEVTKSNRFKAIENNYGLTDEQAEKVPKENAFSAYMLVYIKDSELSTVLQDVSVNDVPEYEHYYPIDQEIKKSFYVKPYQIDIRITVKIILEDCFERYTGTNLFDPETANYITLEVDATTTLDKFIELLAATLNYSIDNMRLWPIYPRISQVDRPTHLSVKYRFNQTIESIVNKTEWYLFVELLPCDSILKHLPMFDEEWDVLLLFKMYDPKNLKLIYCGHFYASLHSVVADLIPTLNERAGFPIGTELDIYEEISPSQVVHLTNLKHLSLRKNENGDILIFQKKVELEEEYESYALPTCADYFKHYLFKMDMQFLDKKMLDAPFILQISGYMSYNQMAKSVALYLHTKPYNLRFFKVSNDMGPGLEIRRDFIGYIEQLFYCESQPSLYFEKLSESEKKVPFMVTFLKSNFQIGDKLLLYVRQKPTVAELIEEAKMAVTMDCDGSTNLRLLEVKNNRVNPIGLQETILDPLQSDYRIEEIPMDELILNKDEVLISVSHFYHDMNIYFGSPFLVKIENRETVSSLKEKLFKKARIQREIFEKLEILVFYGRKPMSITEDISFKIGGRPSDHPKIWIGINHHYE